MLWHAIILAILATPPYLVIRWAVRRGRI